MGPKTSRTATIAAIGLALTAALALAGCGAGTDQTQPSPGASEPSEGQNVTSETPSQEATAEGTGELQITDVKVGTGAEAVAGKTITVNYTLWLADGTKIQSSVGGEPFTFQLGTGQVIPGWDEGVVGMKVGGKRKLTIPPELAYGSNPPPGIPANATLVFEIDLLKVQ